MLGFGTTAGKIDDFETRFTVVNGAHFLISGNGKEAWPITAAEAEAFKRLYRRNMNWARWLRQITVGGPVLLILLGNVAWLPQPVRAAMGTLAVLLILIALAFAIQLHPIVSFLTKRDIERRLTRRIATQMPAAATPSMTPMGRFARRLLFLFVALELILGVARMLLGPTIFAELLGLDDALGNGDELWFWRLTAGFSPFVHLGLLAAFLLLVADRRSRRLAALSGSEGGDGPALDVGRRLRLPARDQNVSGGGAEQG